MVVGRLPAYGQGRGGPPDDARATFAQRATILDRIDGGLTEPESAAMAAFEISADEETRLGRLTARKFTDYLAGHGIRVAQTGRDVDYLRKLVTTVRPLMTNADRYRRPTVYLVQSPRCDARVFPGGHLFFFRGLLDAVDNEAALVGVIGHELSHVDRGHALARVRQVLLLDDTFKGQWQNMTCQQSEAVRAAAVRIWDSPLDPEAEAEADRDGVRWAFQAGYDASRKINGPTRNSPAGPRSPSPTPPPPSANRPSSPSTPASAPPRPR
jgi:predicted Zn-dependent protease